VIENGMGSMYIARHLQSGVLSMAVRSMNKQHVTLFGTNNQQLDSKWSGQTKPASDSQLHDVATIEKAFPEAKMLTVEQSTDRLWWLFR
jgi:hypothetical protein